MAEGRSEFPGYYPGSPIFRQPRPFRGSKAPKFYEPGMADEFFESLMTVPEYAWKVPSWLWKEEINRIKGSFNQFSAPDYKGNVSTEAYQAFGPEELEELPGAVGAAIDYNPVNWVTKPGETLKKHLQKHWGAITDNADFKQRVQRELWARNVGETKSSPYYIDNAAYESVKKELPRFMSTSASSFTRNGSFKDFNIAVLTSLNTELKDPSKLARFADDDQKIVNKFSAQVGVSETMKELDKSLDDMKKTFDAGFFSVKARSPKAISTQVESLHEKLAKAEAAIEFAKDNKVFDRHVKSYKNFVDGVRSKIAEKYEPDPTTRDWVLKRGSDSSIYGALSVESEKLFRATIDGGLGGSYVRKVVNQNVRNANSKLNSTMRSKDSSGFIVSDSGRKMGLIAGTATRTWEWRSTWDLVQDIEKGRLPTQFIFNRLILPRIERYTPSYHLKRWFLAEYMDADGNKKFKRRLVNFFEGARYKHNFNINVAGMGSVLTYGGKHFDIKAEVLEGLLKNSGTNIVGLFNEDAALLAANGFKSGVAFQLKKTRLWLIQNAKTFGLQVDPSGLKLIDSVDNQKRLASIFAEIKRRRLDPSEFDPSLAKLSLHGKYARTLTKIQNSVFAKVYKYTFKTWDIVAEKLIDWGGRILEKIFGAATGGIGYAIAWVARIILVYIVQKTVKKVAEVYEAVKKMDLRYFENATQEVFLFVAKTVGVLGVGCLLIMMPIMFVVQVLIASFSSIDTSKIGGSVIDTAAVDIPPTNFYADPTCGNSCEPPSVCLDRKYGYFTCVTTEDLPGGGQEQL